MKAFTPEDGIGGEEIFHLMPAEIENERAPVLVRTLARVLMLVKRCAVEAGERPFVARKMRRHPVDEHANTSLVQGVDEKLKVIRRAVTAGRRIKSGDLIAP